VGKINAKLSKELFTINNQKDLEAWLEEAKKSLGGVSWKPLGQNENNVHTVEVASDPALALIERPTNSIDALLDLKHLELGEKASSPHEAAQKWFGVPKGGLSEASSKELQKLNLADLIRITVHESGDGNRPTISIQDQGTGQHPHDFEDTLLSLHGSNKKSARHLMGVYGAGGSASYRFAHSTIVVSRRAPSLLEGRPDEIGMTLVRYNKLDAEKYKTGRYEYLVTSDGKIPRLDLTEVPDLMYGTYVKLIEYQIDKYSGPAYAPQRSLYQLLHAALPDPALPVRVVETRAKRYAGVKGEQERRQINGLQYLLNREETSDYKEVRRIPVGRDMGHITLRYFVLSDKKQNPYTTAAQGLTITLNGQRQVIKERAWLKRKLELFFLFKRLIVLVDATELSSEAKREMFSSTRESGVDTQVTREILDLVIQEIQDDEDLYAFEEAAKSEALKGATERTSTKVKKHLATEIGAYLQGAMRGSKGGKKKTSPKGPRKPTIRNTDDSEMLEIPDKLRIISDLIRVEQGRNGSFRLEINAKNDFLPKYEAGLSVVIGPELKDHIEVRSKGRLLGGRVRVSLSVSDNAPIGKSSAKVALVIPELGVMLSDEKGLEVTEPKPEKDDGKSGGDLDIKIQWVKQDKWEGLGDDWDENKVGMCEVHRGDPVRTDVITRAEWTLNEDFEPLRRVIEARQLSEAQFKSLMDAYEYPVALGLFHQQLAIDEADSKAEEEGREGNVPRDYQKSEQIRLASAVLLALQPEIHLAEAVDD